MQRVEAVIFAAPKPVPEAVLQTVVGERCNLRGLLADIQAELAARPFELVEAAGGWRYQTKQEYGPVIRSSGVWGRPQPDLIQRDLTVLMAIAYFQPITRVNLSAIMGKAVSRDVISSLSRKKLIAPGARSPQPGAPYTYITTTSFLDEFGFKSLADLPDMDQLVESGLLDKDRLARDEDAFETFVGAGAAHDVAFGD